MSGWPPWNTRNELDLARYASTRSAEFLPPVPRYRLARRPDGNLAVAQALYEAIRTVQIQYDLETYDPSEVRQVIRTPHQMVTTRRGTCLDLALLYAGFALANELLPVVVVLDGHALVMVAANDGLRQWDGIRRGRDAFEDAVTDPDLIRQLVTSGAFVPVECTGMAYLDDDSRVLAGPDRVAGHLSFDAAVEHGRRLVLGGDPAIEFAVDVAVTRYGNEYEELEFAPLPTGPRRDEVDRFVIPHEQAVHELKGRRRYLDESQLPFLSPGADHPSEPANLLRRLADPEIGRGVMLLGPAGAGKTRTCQEVAARASEDGWRVLHLLATNRVTTDHVEQAVLRDPSARTLLVLDYLDICAKIEIDELDSRITRPVERSGGQLALLATSRPARRTELSARGADDVFDPVRLRTDENRFTAVAEHIFEKVAKQALTKYGLSALTGWCGRRPVIALLIARDLERLVEAGEPVGVRVGAGTRPDELIRWLRDRLVKDGLLPGPGTAVPADPFAEAAAERTILALALTAALTPGPRPEIEEIVQRLLGDSEDVGRSRVGIDVLTTMGWLEQVGDTLEVAHDIVTDELIRAAVAPVDGLRVHAGALHTLLDAVRDNPAALDRLAGNVTRVHADLDDGLTPQLGRAAAEWIEAHADGLGQTFARSPEGGRALYTMLHAAPWQQSVSAHWGAVVEPWLAREFGANDRIEVMAYSLHTMPPGQAGPIVTAALVWLAGHGTRADADLVLRYLLRRPDLAPPETAVLVDYALRWFRSPASAGRDVTHVLRGLLLLVPRLSDATTRDAVVGVAVRWVRQAPLPWQADYVLRPLIKHVPPADGAVVVDAALNWLAAYSRQRRAAYVLGPLLARPELVIRRIDEVVDHAVAWLDRHAVRSDASYVLRPLLNEDSYRRHDRSRDVVRLARGWLADHRTDESASYLYPGLLTSPHVPNEEAIARYVPDAFAWLDQHTHRTADASWTLRGLMGRYLMMNHADDLAREIVRRATAWLSAGDPVPAQTYVLVPLLNGLGTYDGPTADVVVQLAHRWIAANLGDPTAIPCLRALLDNVGGDPVRSSGAVEAALRWLGRNWEHPGANDVFQTLLSVAGRVGGYVPKAPAVPAPPTAVSVLGGVLGAGDRDAGARRQATAAAVRWLGGNEKHPAAVFVCQALLRGPVDDRRHLSAAVTCGLAWLDEHPDHPTATWTLRALVTAKGVPHRQLRQVADAAFGWMAAHPRHSGVNGVLQAILNTAELDRVHGRAAELAREWLDANPGDPGEGFLVQAVLGARGLDRRGAGSTADRALALVASGLDDQVSNHVLQAILGAKRTLDHDRLALAADTAMSWVRGHPHATGLRHLVQALLVAKVGGGDRIARTIETALTWVEGHPDDPNLGYVTKVLVETKEMDERLAARIADVVFPWLHANMDNPNAGYALQALFKAKRLDLPRLRRAAQAAFEWLAGQPGGDAVPFVIRSLLLNNRLTDDDRTRAADVAFGWIRNNPGARTRKHAVQGLLKARRLDGDRRRQAVELSLEWLASGADEFESSFLLQDLLRLAFDDDAHRGRVFDAASTWLAAHPDSRETPAVFRTALSATSLDVDHAVPLLRSAIGWIGRNTDTRGVEITAQGLVECPLLADPAVPPGITGEVAAAAFRWLDRTGEAPGRGHVIRALLSVQWLPGEYADRAVAVALSALTGVELLEGRHSIIALLLERAELQPDSGVDTAAVVELALRRVDGMSTSDRAYVYGRLARLDGVPVEAFDRILGWLATDEAQRHRGAVLPGLMRNPSLSTEQRGRVTDLATDALVGTVLSADAGIVNALPSPTDLTVEQAARITAWIDDSAAGIRDPVLLNVLLRRPDLTGPRRAELRRAAQDVLVTIDDERDCSSLATALLADAAITDDEIDELLAGTAGRVERTALVIAIAGRQHVHERHRRLVDDQFSAAWAAGERRHVLRLLKEAFGPEAPDGRWPSLRDLARRCLAAHPDLAEGVVVPEEPDGPEESGPAQNGPAQNGPAQNGADRAGQNGAGRAGRDADGLPSEPGRRSFWRRLLPGRRR